MTTTKTLKTLLTSSAAAFALSTGFATNAIAGPNADCVDGADANTLECGDGSNTTDDFATAVDVNTNAAIRSTAIGFTAQALNDSSIAIGSIARATGNGAIAVGQNSNASQDGATAVGRSSQASDAQATALGQ